MIEFVFWASMVGAVGCLISFLTARSDDGRARFLAIVTLGLFIVQMLFITLFLPTP